MLKNISLLVILCCLVSFAYAQEEITITTYYPSPFGSYQELETETLFFRETTNGLISFNDVNNDNIYNRRLRITAGESDTGHNDQGASIDLQGNAAGGRLDLVAGRGGYTSFWTSPAGTTEAERMRITAAGNVGIGTAGPLTKLHVAASTDGENLFLGQSNLGTDGWYQSVYLSDGRLEFRRKTAGSTNTRVTFQNGGNVGIGTASPTAKLHVAGTAGTDGIKFPDGSLQRRATNIYYAIGTTNISTNSTSWVDMANTTVTIPAGFGGGNAYVHFNAAIRKGNEWVWVCLVLDGTTVLNVTPKMDLMSGANYGTVGIQGGPPVSLTYVIGNLSAGSHTIKAQWKTFSGGKIYQDGNISNRVTTVITGD